MVCDVEKKKKKDDNIMLVWQLSDALQTPSNLP